MNQMEPFPNRCPKSDVSLSPLNVLALFRLKTLEGKLCVKRNLSYYMKPLVPDRDAPDHSSLCSWSLQVYEGGYHALHQDLPEVAESVMKEVINWITERLPTPPQQPQAS